MVVDSIVFAGEGMDYLALKVNDEYVFRFPKLAEAAAKLEVEAALLPELQGRLDLRIPSPELVGVDPSTGLTFVGYRWIEGVPLEQEIFSTLGSEAQIGLMEQIARFLPDLHAFPIDRAARLGLKTRDFKAEYTGRYESVRELVLPRLSHYERAYVERLYDDYLSDPGNFDYEPVVVHADLSPDHVIFDPVTKTIAGIIDLSDVVIGDPDFDLHWLHESYGDGFLSKYLAYNPHPAPHRLRRKLRFFYRSSTVDDVLLGFQRDDREAVESGLAELRAEAAAFR